MESPTERLRRILDDKEQRKKKWACGMCPSCYQNEACPGGNIGASCENYLPPEPTKVEWPDIYRKAYGRTFENVEATEKVFRIGHAKALRDAMTLIHGFSEKEVREMEKEVEDDMHPVPGRRDVLPG